MPPKKAKKYLVEYQYTIKGSYETNQISAREVRLKHFEKDLSKATEEPFQHKITRILLKK